MKIRTLAGAIVSSLVVGVLAAGLLGGLLSVAQATGRYPGAVGRRHEQVNFTALLHGYVGTAGTYFTPDATNTVWHWYAERFAVEPEEATNSGDGCVKLAGVQTLARFGRTVGVTLCAARHGTRVVVSQTYYWRPPK